MEVSPDNTTLNLLKRAAVTVTIICLSVGFASRFTRKMPQSNP